MELKLKYRGIMVVCLILMAFLMTFRYNSEDIWILFMVFLGTLVISCIVLGIEDRIISFLKKRGE